jgi:putative transposase
VQLRYAYRLSPTAGQRQALARAFGCARVVFNDAVAARRAAHEAGVHDNPRHARKAAAKLRRAQELARRQCGSANREKSRRKVARCHARVADTRRDWLHKLTFTVVQENQLIAVEDLAVSGLARTKLARSVHDAGWSTFVGMLAYKAARHGRTFAKVDRWFPSTRACSVCGVIGHAKPLHVREWTCGCGAVHDRDVHAARNILAVGRADSPTLVELVSAGTSVPQPAVKREPAGSTV